MKYAATSGLLLLMLVLPACDSAFESDTPFISPDAYYRNASDALAVVGGVYEQTEEYMSAPAFFGVMEFPTEVVLYEGRPENDGGELNNFVVVPGNGLLSNVYSNAYVAINRANAVLDNVPGIENMNADLRARVVAEARALRALNYWHLAVLFGGVPVLTSETTNLQDLQKPRASAAEVYDLIIEDLRAAIPDLPLQSAYENGDWGRVSKGAAQTLLAKVYLQRGSMGAHNGVTGALQLAQPEDYRNALDLVNEVMNSGEYALIDDYSELFASPPTGGDESEEVILSLQTQFPTGDVYAGLPCDVSPKRANTQSGGDNFGAEILFFTSFPDTDARKLATYATTYQYAGTDVVVTYDIDDIEGDGYEEYTPAFYKYGVAEERCGDANDYLYLRYADVLLMRAEALNEIQGGPTAEAYAAAGEVQERAGAEPLELGLSYDAFREALYILRRRELAFEGHGWPDGQRFFDTFESRVEASAAMAFPQQFWLETVDVQDPLHRLMPIPQQALDRNAELMQNPGY